MDIAYIVGFYEGDKIIPQGNPFILHSDSTIEELAADEGKSESIELTSTTRRSQEISTDGIAKSFLSEGTEYTLSYWKNGWQELGKAVAGDNPLEFADVPSNALYWLVDDGPDHEERIFTIENGRQVWR